MVYDPRPTRNDIVVEVDELHAILTQKKRTLELATMEGYTRDPLPIMERWGWKADWWPIRRDRDGSLLVLITVTDASRPTWKYESRYRLVQRETLIRHLRSRVARD